MSETPRPSPAASVARSSSPTPPPSSSPPAPPSPPPSAFARAWRWLLPFGLAVIAAALGLGVFDTSAASAWVFVAGCLVGLVGLASLANHLFDLGRREVRDLEQRLENELDRRGNGRT
ncbi:hypothetical protein [Pinisolibacter sp.]|uniref:hypothetical protein n=1 Tax=Pinisolibacter sp. TaxID=2172024 RepID=UPI002FDEA230